MSCFRHFFKILATLTLYAYVYSLMRVIHEFELNSHRKQIKSDQCIQIITRIVHVTSTWLSLVTTIWFTSDLYLFLSFYEEVLKSSRLDSLSNNLMGKDFLFEMRIFQQSLISIYLSSSVRSYLSASLSDFVLI